MLFSSRVEENIPKGTGHFSRKKILLKIAGEWAFFGNTNEIVDSR